MPKLKPEVEEALSIIRDSGLLDRVGKKFLFFPDPGPKADEADISLMCGVITGFSAGAVEFEGATDRVYLETTLTRLQTQVTICVDVSNTERDYLLYGGKDGPELVGEIVYLD